MTSSQYLSYLHAGLAAYRAGALERAQAMVQSALQIQPASFDALNLMGLIAYQAGQFDNAAEAFRRALLVSANAEVYYNQGNALSNLGRNEEALLSYDNAVALKPDHAFAHLGRGNALSAMGSQEQALASYDRSIALAPGFAMGHYNRARLLYEMNRLPESLASYDKAIALEPNYFEALDNRGTVLRALLQHQAALASHRRAIAVAPGKAAAYCNLAMALHDLGQYEAAIGNYEKAMAIEPLPDIVQEMYLHTRMKICDWAGFDDEVARLERNIKSGKKVSSAFPLLALVDSLPLQRKAAESLGHRANGALGALPRRLPGDKIRLGYFSADYRNHPITTLITELFECHDRQRFEVIGFSFGPDAQDRMRQRVTAAFDQFHDVRAQSERDIAALARSLGIDIAIDLMGLTHQARLGIFGYRAAPIQVNYLGYPGTLGVDFIDYLIADKTLIPESSRPHYAEKIVYLPDSYQVNTKREMSDKVFTREECSLPRDAFVYCCFNNNYKITPATFDQWMRILMRVEAGVLWLRGENPTAVTNLRREADRRGVDPARLVFAPRLALPEEHLARHRLADLFLDTLPYNAHTTASDALWAGLPVLTLIGESYASRVGASVLRAIDLPELVTSTRDEYESAAVSLATKRDQLASIRRRLEANRLSTPLFDTKRFTRHLEQAYLAMLDRYQAGLPPDHIEIA
jgi:predicted O-linked N-acetylglucosamine transferase (SPINDLY family)